MNIRVDLNTPIKDGTEVVFRSPVDCSQVTGLKVYYLGGAMEFAFADAHGNNVGDIDHLFAENVAVKVILDVTHGMAFVQNADTNAYLEGRFDDIIDKLCPDINEKGILVQCEPVEGYPLTVSVKEDGHVEGVTVTVCGKNLYNPSKEGGYPLTDGYWINKGSGAVSGEGKHAEYCATQKAIPVSHLRGQYITLNYRPLGNAPGMAFYDQSDKYLGSSNGGDGGKGLNVKVPENAWFMRFTSLMANKNEVQIEIGSQPTAYDPYSDEKFKVSGDAASEFIPVTGVVGRAGVMTVYAKNGKGEITDVKVSGRADPVAIIEKLMQAVFPVTVSNEEE